MGDLFSFALGAIAFVLFACVIYWDLWNIKEPMDYDGQEPEDDDRDER